MNIAEYQKITQDIGKLEQGIVKLKEARETILNAAFEADGKGHVYDVDGVMHVIQMTKSKTHFLAPKDKWAKASREPKEPKAPKVKKEKVPKEPKAALPKVDPKEAFQAALAASKANAVTPVVLASQPVVPVAEPAVNPVEVTATLTAKAVVDEVKVTPVAVAAPAPVVEMDPLEAALADLNS